MPLKEKTVKKIFLFFAFYLPFQYILVGVVGVMYSEPWPAFVLPGFKNVYATQDHVEITEPKFFAEPAESAGESIEIEPSDLFKGLPTSQLQGFLRSNFSDEVQFSAEARNWLREELSRLYPQKEFEGLKVEWTPVVYHAQKNEVKTIPQKSTKTINIPFADQ